MLGDRVFKRDYIIHCSIVQDSITCVPILTSAITSIRQDELQAALSRCTGADGCLPWPERGTPVQEVPEESGRCRSACCQRCPERSTVGNGGEGCPWIGAYCQRTPGQPPRARSPNTVRGHTSTNCVYYNSVPIKRACLGRTLP